MSEAEIQRQILLKYGARADMRIWRSNTGAMKNPAGQLVRFGTPGQADITGVMLPHGRAIYIEVKSATGRQSTDQIAFQAMVERFGGAYCLARSVEDVDRFFAVQS